MGSLTRVVALGIALLGVGGVARAQTDTQGVKGVGVDVYRSHVARLQVLVKACQKDSAACDVKAVGDDEWVEVVAFQARWAWLREALASAHDKGLPGRDRVLQEAAARLDEDAAMAAETVRPLGGEFERARRGADGILGRPEFQTVTEQSYLEREIAAFFQWLDKVFGGVAWLGRRSPWLVPFIQWGAITLAAAGLLVWVWRTMQRQRLAIAFEMGAHTEVWQKESDNWAEMARAEADSGDWREAVHCLYWATIVMMDGKKLWRQNRARTPREYVLLLEAGSGVQQALRRLTQIFERIWYGLRPAAESDYEGARALFEELRAA